MGLYFTLIMQKPEKNYKTLNIKLYQTDAHPRDFCVKVQVK